MGGPSGTVTFLFTDIEGSSGLWDRQREAMSEALPRHDAIVAGAVERRGGIVFKRMGDGMACAFATAADGLAAALEAQRALHATDWGELGALSVRMALHTGVAEEREGDYFGPVLNRAARLLGAGHGGQTLLSLATEQLVRDALPAGTSLRDLGVRRLRDLTHPEHVYQLVADGLPSDFPQLRTLEERPNNLPVQATPLIGRERELAAVKDLLGRSEIRLVTLTGPGGMGKTRLSLQVAADLIHDFEDGAFLVELAWVGDPMLVATSIAQALGVKDVTGKEVLESVKEDLRYKQLLLLLDNLEQVVGAAPIVADLLAHCPRLKVLVTSRIPLHLRGEQEYPLPPLPAPDPRHPPSLDELERYDAARLFIERARAVRPDFTVTDETLPILVDICYRLDGLPLALELAAARVKLLPLPALRARLEQGLAVLAGGARDLPQRQQALRATIAWSDDLLDPPERTLYRRLGIFAGGFDLEAAEAVANARGDLEVDMFEGVASLVDKSLVGQQEQDGEARFAMLETIRAYALEQLRSGEEHAAVADAHASYYLGVAEDARERLFGPEQRRWLERLDRDHDNFRAALRWTLDGAAAETGLRLAVALAPFWGVRGYSTDGRLWLGRGLERTADGPGSPVRARAFRWSGTLAREQGDYAVALSRLEEALAMARRLGEVATEAAALRGLGHIASDQADHDRARSLLDDGLARSRVAGDEWGTAQALGALAGLALHRGDRATALSLMREALATYRKIEDKRGIASSLQNIAALASADPTSPGAAEDWEEGLAILRELGDKRGIARALAALGQIAYRRGDFSGARAYLDEALATYRQVGDRMGYAIALLTLANLFRLQGDYAAARRAYQECLGTFREIGHKAAVAISLKELAAALEAEGDFAGGRARFEEARTLAEELGDRRGATEALVGVAIAARCLDDLAAARTASEEALAGAREHGQEALIPTLQHNLGVIALREGDAAAAAPRFREGLRLSQRHDDAHGIVRGLVGLAGVACLGGDAERAARLLGAAEAALAAGGSAPSTPDRAELERAAAAARAALGDERFAAAASIGRNRPLAEALAGLEDPRPAA